MATAISSVLKIRRAERKKIRARIALFGPSGAGKTFTALRCAHSLLEVTETSGREGNRILLISSESGATEKYLGLAPDGWPWDFDIIDLPDFSPQTYTDAFLMAAQEKYDVLIVDSWSHAWEGVGGVLDMVDNSNDKNRFAAWKLPSQLHQRMVLAALHSPTHLICTMRSKMEYVQEEVNGRKTVRKVGMAPIQRPGMEYEFDVTFDMDLDHIITVGKTRCPDIDGAKTIKPSVNFFMPLARWLSVGSAVPADYYAASEADLAKLERAQRAEAPRMSAAEMAARAAAAQFGTDAAGGMQAGGDGATAGAAASVASEGATAETAVNGSSAAGSSNGVAAGAFPPSDGASAIEPATDRQVDYIKANFRAAFDSAPEFAAFLQSKGAAKIAELTKDNASDVIGEINNRLRAKGLKEPKPGEGQPQQSATTEQPPFETDALATTDPAAETKKPAKRGRKSKAEKEAEAAAVADTEDAESAAAGDPPNSSNQPPDQQHLNADNPAYAALREWAAKFSAERSAMMEENNGMATPTQRKQMQEIVGRLGISQDEFAGRLATLGAASCRSLTVDQCNDLYSELLAKELGLAAGGAPKN